MDFGKLKTWMKKMNQILELYQDNDEFTSTEKALLLDYTNKMKIEIQKLSVLDSDEEIEEQIIIAPTISKSKAETKIPSAEVITPDSTIATPPVVENSINKPIVELTQYSGDLFPELFDHLDVVDLSSKLELKPLSDIKLGMGLNEKIQTQNELFNGDKNAFDDTIQSLNQCADFNAAKLYLCEHIIPKYNWSNASKEKTVNTFIKLVKRRHL